MAVIPDGRYARRKSWPLMSLASFFSCVLPWRSAKSSNSALNHCLIVCAKTRSGSFASNSFLASVFDNPSLSSWSIR